MFTGSTAFPAGAVVAGFKRRVPGYLAPNDRDPVEMFAMRKHDRAGWPWIDDPSFMVVVTSDVVRAGALMVAVLAGGRVLWVHSGDIYVIDASDNEHEARRWTQES